MTDMKRGALEEALPLLPVALDGVPGDNNSNNSNIVTIDGVAGDSN